MRRFVIVSLALGALLLAASMAMADYGEYFWVVAGHDIAGTGQAQAGVTPYFSAEDWIVGTPAYRGPGGPDAVRRLPNGQRAPLGKTPTERTGAVRVALAGLEAIGAEAHFDPMGRMATISHEGRSMVVLTDSRTALVSGKVVTMADTAAVRAGKLYVPLKDVATHLLGLSADDASAKIHKAIAQ